MSNAIWRKEGNVLFNDALNTFYLQLFGALAWMRNKIINNSHVAKSLLSRKEVFYLMTLSIHFIDGYMVLELFLIPSSTPWQVQQRAWYVLFCLWDGAYERTLAANQKK